MKNENIEPRHSLSLGKQALYFAFIVLGSVSAMADSSVHWALYNNCPGSNAVNEIACGTYGTFYIDSPAPTHCQLVGAGSEVPPRYFPNHYVQDFPSQPVPIEQRRGSLRLLDQISGPLSQTPVDTTPVAPVFIGIIDFSGAHGNSVEWLIKEVAGNVSTRKFLLDGDESQAHGGVSDLEVLSQLCGVSDYLERHGDGFQSIINMSFGRAVRDDDPVEGVACQGDRLNCQIKKIIEHLDEKGTVLVGAVGKQRESMFPAAINRVIAAGMINPAEFKKKGTTRPTWEMPNALDALMPGSSLCIRGGWTAPSGASYSSAIMSGWLAQLMSENAPLLLHEEGRWVPYLSQDRQCMVLSKNGNEYTQCNAAIEEIFFGLEGGYSSDCWSTGSGVSVQAVVKSIPYSQPLATAAIQWDPLVRPSPEGDPCVPCTGGSINRHAGASKAPFVSFNINLSQTESLADDVMVDAVHLRLGSTFYQIEMNDDQLIHLRDGNVGIMKLDIRSDLIEDADSASLFFSLRDADAPDCETAVDQPPACVWMSTHIHIP